MYNMGTLYRHPNVVAILGVSRDEKRPVVIYENMANLSLYDVLHLVQRIDYKSCLDI